MSLTFALPYQNKGLQKEKRSLKDGNNRKKVQVKLELLTGKS